MNPMADQPWLMRTYSGHSTARASNELYRTNLAKGQTGLSIAFDLPTQTGYDPDDPMAAGEVGKVGVPVAHLGHLRTLLDGIPPGEMNTSMTINATAAWLLGLYVANADEQGVPSKALRGTTQNDLVKEYLSRGTYIFPPEASRRIIVDMVAWCSEHTPKWNPTNVCSYHLQEAGATPVQEIAFALATAIGVLDAVRDSGQVPPERFPAVVGSISFFVNAGIRFIEEICKLRAFTELWDRICEQRYGVADPALRRFRYGVQVNSLGLTEAQPENNVQRIVLEMLAVTLSKRARARSVQLPAWNEALGLPRPWDQQWSLRMQQVLAFETDLLEYDDVFDGSQVIEGRTAELIEAAQAELDDVLALGGAFEAIEVLKGRLVASLADRTRRIEAGEQTVVGVNRFTETTPSPLGGAGSIMTVDPQVEADTIAELQQWRATRDNAAVEQALADLRAAATGTDNLMTATIALARAGGTTGEWAGALREIFGEYRAPTGVSAAVGRRGTELEEVARRVKARPGGPPRLLVAKPGLDGHSNGAEQIAVAARDAGMEVIYSGIRLTPAQIAAAARDEDPDVIGLSILSGSHLQAVATVMALLADYGVDAPVVVGGIIPPDDQAKLSAAGVAAVYTPKDYVLARIMDDIVSITERHRAAPGH
jgi:(2R)-ethylmalonyl-CoA mutase